MAGDEPEKPAPPKRRRWLRWIGWGFLILLGLVVIFHRPIFFEGTRYFIIRAAEQQKFDLDYEIEGSIFSTLRVFDLVAKPTEESLIKRLEIGDIALEYSLVGLLRHGLPGFLDKLVVKDVYVVTDLRGVVLPPLPEEIKFPALFPKEMRVENVNYTTLGSEGDFVLEGLSFALLPQRPGGLEVRVLDVPGVHRWTDLSARTTFENRNLVLSQLSAGPELALDRVNLDASKLDDGIVELGLEGLVFDAVISLAARVEGINKSNRLDVNLRVGGLVLERLWEYFALDVPFYGRLDELSFSFKGLPMEPQSWAGEVKVQLDAMAFEQQQLGSFAATMGLTTGVAQAAAKIELDEANRVEAEVRAQLPKEIGALSHTELTGWLRADLANIAAFTSELAQPVEGDVAARVDFKLENQWVFADVKATAGSLATGDVAATKTEVTAHVEKNLAVEAGRPVYDDLGVKLKAGLESLRIGDYTLDALALEGSVDEEKVLAEKLTFAKGANTAKLSARYVLPEDMQSFLRQPLAVEVAVHAPDLSAFLAEDAVAELKGSLKIDGKLAAEEGLFDGDFVIEGREITASGLGIPAINGTVAVVDNQAQFSAFEVVLDEKNRIEANGVFGLAEPHAYNGSLSAKLQDLAVFDAVSPEPLAGALDLEWRGNGNVSEKSHTGTASLSLRDGRYGEQKNLSAQAEANYSPEIIDIPVLDAAADVGSVSAKVRWEQKRLTVSDLVAKLKALEVVRGTLSIPLDLEQAANPERLIPADQPISASLKTPELALAAIHAQFSDDETPITGTLRGELVASGTMDALAANLDLRATNVESTIAEQIEPADVVLDVAMKDDRLAVNGSVRQPLIQPLVIAGGMPLDLAKVRKEQRIDPETPVELSIKMPRSSVKFLAALVPAIRFVDGTAAIDTKVEGTLAAPRLTGSLDAILPHLNFTEESMPPISDFQLEIDATQERLTISRLSGGIAGGSFGAGGTVEYRDFEKPLLNLRIFSKDALVLQDEAITLRVNSDLKIVGPLDSASVSGGIYVTKSRFYKNIDILPIGLPGRPAPQPPEAPAPPGIPDPPLRDWKFDVVVRTADPFLVQGNLANGRVVIDLALGGTGMRPWLDGSVRIERLVTSLPFSELNIDNGFVYFNRAQPFVPRLDIQGTSNIRDYDITVYVFGSALNPQATFVSNPPLPQADIVSLISTGVTSRELGDAGVLAGRAAILLFRKVYGMIFPGKTPGPGGDSFLSRIDLSVGVTDPKTGRQSATVRVPITENIALLGGLDVGGDFRGEVRYLIRFP